MIPGPLFSLLALGGLIIPALSSALPSHVLQARQVCNAGKRDLLHGAVTPSEARSLNSTEIGPQATYDGVQRTSAL